MPDSLFIRYPSTIAVLYFLLAAVSVSARILTCTDYFMEMKAQMR